MVDVSVIIGTRNRAEQLLTCLNYMAGIRTTLTWELIVADNASTDETRNVIEAFISAHPEMNAHYMYSEKKGVANTHNAAVATAKGRILSFIDDDCYVQESHVDDVVNLFSGNDIAYAGGGIVLFDETDATLTTNYTSTLVELQKHKWVSPYWVQGANLMFLRQIFLDYGGFDGHFGAGGTFSGADAELCNRISKGGLTGCFSPLPLVKHHHGRKEGTTEKLEYFYAFGFGAIFAKNFDFSMYGLDALRATLRHYRDLRSVGDGKTATALIKGALAFLKAKEGLYKQKPC